MSSWYSCDRIENGIAVLVGDDKRTLEIPTERFKQSPKEGDMFRMSSGEPVLDGDETERRRKALSQLTRELSGDGIEVTAIMPIYNEERYIENAVKSLLHQTFPKNKLEIFLIDGGSTDNTPKLIEKMARENSQLVKIFQNSGKTQARAMNIGIKNARGRYIMRFDAHAFFPPDYIQKCVDTIERMGADNVGGFAETVGLGPTGEAFAQVSSSLFGVGNSRFRTGGSSGEVDTVPFGTYRREFFETYGGYNERLDRGEDNELNYRLRKNGLRVWIDNDIMITYYCRDSVKKIASFAFQNGKWNVITQRLCPGSLGLRHFIPAIFVLSLLVLIPLACFFRLAFWLLVCELAAYLLLDIIFSFKNSNGRKNHPFRKLYLFPLFHITYGWGSLCGLCKVIFHKL